jgi:hypothetical protein
LVQEAVAQVTDVIPVPGVADVIAFDTGASTALATMPESISSPVEFVLLRLPLVNVPLAAGSLVPAVPWTDVKA